MSKERYVVSAIERGTVIDHIVAGQGIRIIRLLQLADLKKQVTLGLNFPSKSLNLKDLIKITGKEITEEEASRIAIFAPQATINVVRNYEVIRKFQVELPKTIEKVIRCPNLYCITNHEPMSTSFFVKQFGHHVELECRYCEKSFSHDSY